jgi:hypothetical protein
MDLEPHKTTLPMMVPFTINWDYYRQLLKQAISGNPNITLVEEIDAPITIFTSTIKSAKNASKLYHICPPRDPAIPDIEKILRRKRRARKNIHNFNRAAYHRQYNFLNNYIHHCLKHSRIQRFEKDSGNASKTNSIWKITKGFTKHQTQCHTSVIHGRRGLTRGLTYTTLGKVTAVAEVYEDQFRSNPKADEFDNFCQQIR